MAAIATSFLTSNEGLALIVTIFGSLWTLFQGSQFWKQYVQGKFDKAILAVEAGVEQTYRAYVQGLKTAPGATGTLTAAQANQARDLAKAAAVEYGKKNGVDIVSTLGQEFVDLYLTRAVNKAKGVA